MRLRNKLLLNGFVVGVLGFWGLSMPQSLDQVAAFDQPGDPVNGQIVFSIGGCASCHMANGAKGAARLLLGGGQVFVTPFGSFIAPNISPDPETGIGGWSAYDLANAVIAGVGPDGNHYYPVLPYASYARMDISDAIDLKAYLDTLQAVNQMNTSHELPFLFRWRRPLGLWKRLFVSSEPMIETPEARGQYLVEALGHCAECHSPRNILGGIQADRWLAGAPNPDGRGRIPNITPHAQGLAGWSVEDTAYYLATGFTPAFDSAGGNMVEVINNLSQLSDDDRLAIAQYLKLIPPLPDAAR